jgi:hypothetical protein
MEATHLKESNYMRSFILLITFSVSLLAKGQDFLTDVPLSNTYNIKVKQGTATIFRVHYKGKNYYVTARHLFPSETHNTKISFELTADSTARKVDGNLLLHKDNRVDIAVIEPIPNEPFSQAISIETPEIPMGDNGFFLGFPMGLNSADRSKINKGFPFPLVKRANLSGVSTVDDIHTLFLDGHNNPGFSGGPVLFKNRFKPADNTWYLAGVVSGYYNQKNQLMTPYGPMNIDENSGIMVAYGASHIKEIIDNK